MPRAPRYDLARKVVEEPRPSLLPYLAAALVFGLLAWTYARDRILPSNEAPAMQTSNSSPTRGDLRTLFSADDYPARALENNEQGTVQAALAVDESGSVRGCTVIRSSGSAALDAATCRILQQRARFIPARDANGRPVADRVVTPPITWRLEG